MCESVEVTPTHPKAERSIWKMVLGVLGERRELPAVEL